MKKRNKKYLALFFFLFVSIFVCGKSAKAETSGNWTYSIESSGLVITEYTGNEQTVVIPSSLDGYVVSAIGFGAFENNYSLRSLTIPAKIREIGGSAFRGCTGLSEIRFNATNCSCVSTSFLGVGSAAESLTVIFGSGVIKVPDWIFANGGSSNDYDHVTSVSIPSTVTAIGHSAFSGCRDLTSISWSTGVSSIGYDAFKNCVSLKTLSFPSSLKSIEFKAFQGCSGLTKLTLNAKLSEIGSSAFEGCVSLSEIRVNATDCSCDRNIFSGAGSAVESLAVIFESGVVKVPAWIFGKNNDVPAHVTSVSIPSTVTAIGYRAFSGCEDLTSISWSTGVSSIEKYAFTNCVSLKTLSCPSSLKSIGSYAFEGCSGMTKLTLNAKLSEIGQYAFRDCQALSSLTVNSTGLSVGDKIFENAGYSANALSVSFAEGVTSVPKAMFHSSCVTSVTLPSSVTNIGDKAFYSCQDLKTVTVNRNYMTEIGTDVFYNCPSALVVKCYCNGDMDDYCEDAGIKRSYLSPRQGDISSLSNYSSGIHLSWNKSNGANGYQIWRKTGSGSYALVKTVTSGEAGSWTDTDVKSGTSYTYKIRAYCPTGSSNSTKQYGSYSAEKSRPFLSRPTVSLSNVASTGKIRLSWGSVSGAAKYEVYRASGKDGAYTKISTQSSTSVVSANNIVPGKIYYYKVRAVTGNGYVSAYSEVKSCVCRPAQPVITLENVASTGKIKISWPKVEGASKYEIYRASSKDGSYTKISTQSSTSVTSSNGLVPGKTYYYKVRAVTENGYVSAYSEAKHRACRPAQPVITLENVASTGKIKISWPRVEGAAKYEVYRASSASGTYTKISTQSSISVTNSSGLVPGKTYYYKVRAVTENGYISAYSAVKSRVCDCAKPVVSISLSSGKPRLSWAAVEGADSYKVYRSTSADGSYSLLKTVSGTSFTNTGAVAGQTYYYKVKAVSSLSSSADSAYSTVKSIQSK